MKRARTDEGKERNKQLSDLLRAARGGTIRRTQGANAHAQESNVPIEELTAFLRTKLETQRLAASRKDGGSYDCFSYLGDHAVGTPADVVRGHHDVLVRDYGLCSIASSHLQIKIPCSSIRPTDSDLKNGKLIGIIQVQSYAIAEILGQAGDLLSNIEAVLADGKRKAYCHLCKQKCLTPLHAVEGDSVLNKANDYCPAYWVLGSRLVSLCACHPTRKCLAPGQYFNRAFLAPTLQAYWDSFVAE